MDIRTYEARTMQEALDRVRQDLGADAVILHTRERKRHRWLGLRRQPCLEVTAAVGVTPGSAEAESALADALHPRIDALVTLVEDLCRRKVNASPDLPPVLRPVYARLLDAQLDESIASDLVCGLRDELSPTELAQPTLLQERLAGALQHRIATAGAIECSDGQCKVVAMLGPTGAGKTTSLAKLAANFKLRHQRRVGLVTVDTYRIAAVEQLRVYAEIIDLPMRVVMTPREMAVAVDEMRHLDLVLIDSVGRSPNDHLRIKELKSLLAEAHAQELHLVLSAVSSPAALLAAIDSFGALEPNRVLLTKLDEATSLGGALSVLARAGLPISYVTAGQNVPEDIEVADSADLARRVVAALATLCREEVRRAA
jgi:flagellar biosynthesis protein FlhF